MKKLLPVVLVFCIVRGFLLGEEKEEIRQSIFSILKKQEIAWNQGSIDGFMNHYWKSDRLIFQSTKEKILSWKTMIERYKKISSKYDGGNKIFRYHCQCSVPRSSICGWEGEGFIQ